MTAQILPTGALRNIFSLSLLEVRGQFKYVWEVTELPLRTFVQAQVGGVLCQVKCNLWLISAMEAAGRVWFSASLSKCKPELRTSVVQD